MERTADFHQKITDSFLEHPAGIAHDTTPLHAAVDVLDSDTTTRHRTIGDLLFVGELLAARFLGRHHNDDIIACKGEKPQILEQFAPRRQGIGRRISNPLIVDTPFIRVTQKQNQQRRIDQEYVLQRMAFFLAAITDLLFIRVLGAWDPSLGAIVTKRGDVSVVVAAGSAAIASSAVWRAAGVTCKRCARSARFRLGVSPNVANVAWSTGNKT